MILWTQTSQSSERHLDRFSRFRRAHKHDQQTDKQTTLLRLQQQDMSSYCCDAAWRSGNGVGRINEVTLRRAQLVLGWVTCPGSTPRGGTLFRYVTSHPGQLSLSSFRSRQMSSKFIQMCATLLGQRHLVNAYEMHAGWLIPFVDKRVGWQVKLCEPRAIQPRVTPLVTVKSSPSVGRCAFL